MAELLDLDFGPGVSFEKLVFQRFGCTVSPVSSLSPASFHLVASFGRSALRLNVVSVGTILKSCLGGTAKDFNVIHLSGWMFKFSVSSKNVGILIRKTNCFIRKSFAIFFSSRAMEDQTGAVIIKGGWMKKKPPGPLFPTGLGEDPLLMLSNPPLFHSIPRRFSRDSVIPTIMSQITRMT